MQTGLLVIKVMHHLDISEIFRCNQDCTLMKVITNVSVSAGMPLPSSDLNSLKTFGLFWPCDFTSMATTYSKEVFFLLNLEFFQVKLFSNIWQDLDFINILMLKVF